MVGARDAELFTGIFPFVMVAREKSFRLAARRLGMTPSGVSKAIARLEAELGVRLFHRSARSVTLTSEGESFLLGSEAAVESLRTARERVTLAQRAVRGALTVSLPLLLGERVIVPALGPFCARHPQLTLRMQLTDRLVDLAAEGVDVVVRIGAPASAGLYARKLASVRWVTVAAPSYLAQRGRPTAPEQLAEHDCLSFVLSRGTLQPWLFRTSTEPLARVRPLSVRGPLALDHGAALIDAARAGLGIFQAHDYAVADALTRGELVELLADRSAEGPPIHLLHAQGRRSAAKLRAFAALVADAVARVRPS